MLFAMEMSTRWRKELTWRAFMACAITVVVIRLLNKSMCGHGLYDVCKYLKYSSLITFEVRA